MYDPINAYFELLRTVHEYFGYKEDWVNIPLEDLRGNFWHLTGEGPGYVLYSEQSLTLDLIDEGTHYEAEIYTQRFLPKWVYRGEKYTMVCMDTHTDGNKFLGIFENDKEIKDENLSDKAWGI